MSIELTPELREYIRAFVQLENARARADYCSMRELMRVVEAAHLARRRLLHGFLPPRRIATTLQAVP